MVERDVQAILTELVRRENESSRRLRALEERSSLLEMRAGTLQDAFLRAADERKTFNDKLNERLINMENSILRIDNELVKMNKNLEKMAKKTELKEIENMLSFFNPMKNKFVTRDEVERMMRGEMMFPIPFMKKKAEEPKKVYIPVDMVLNYAAQGLSEQDIMARLQAQGFEPEHIDRALKIALKERVSAPGSRTRWADASESEQADMYGAVPPEQTISRHPPTPLGYPPERVVQPSEEHEAHDTGGRSKSSFHVRTEVNRTAAVVADSRRSRSRN